MQSQTTQPSLPTTQALKQLRLQRLNDFLAQLQGGQPGADARADVRTEERACEAQSA